MDKVILKQEMGGSTSNNFSLLLLEQLARAWQIFVNKKHWEVVFHIPTEYGKGTIRCWNFISGISHIFFDMVLNQKIELKYHLPGKPLSILSFCNMGNIQYKLPNRKVLHTIETMEGSLISQQPGTLQQIVFPGSNQPIKASILAVETRRLLGWINTTLTEEAQLFRKWLEINVEKTNVLPYKISNYRVANCFNQMQQAPGKGLVKMSFAIGKVFELLSYHFQGMIRQKDRFTGAGILHRDDLAKIVRAKEILEADLVNPPVIKSLAKQVGLNQQKLKVGFKLTFGSTINQHLRDIRLEHAFKLLQQEGMMVKEVVAAVGYTNSSHFSRRFKEKFGLLPKMVVKEANERIIEKMEDDHDYGKGEDE